MARKGSLSPARVSSSAGYLAGPFPLAAMNDRRMLVRKIAVAIGLFAAPFAGLVAGPAAAQTGPKASFDCAKAKTPVEETSISMPQVLLTDGSASPP